MKVTIAKEKVGKQNSNLLGRKGKLRPFPIKCFVSHHPPLEKLGRSVGGKKLKLKNNFKVIQFL